MESKARQITGYLLTFNTVAEGSNDQPITEHVLPSPVAIWHSAQAWIASKQRVAGSIPARDANIVTYCNINHRIVQADSSLYIVSMCHIPIYPSLVYSQRRDRRASCSEI